MAAICIICSHLGVVPNALGLSFFPLPVVSKSYSIKESCKKEKEGVPLEMGNTPLILKNFARDTSAGPKNNRYDSSQYFGYPKLYIIENIGTNKDENENILNKINNLLENKANEYDMIYSKKDITSSFI